MVALEQVDQEKKKEVTSVRPKTDLYKNYAIIILLIISGAMFYYYYKKEAIQFVVNGQQIIFASIILVAGLYWYFKQQKIPELPEKDKIAEEVYNWHWKAGYGLLDFTNSQVTQLSDQRAVVEFPLSGKTFTYQAGKGVIEERWRDIEAEIKSKEETELLKTLNKQRIQDESLKLYLKNRGLIQDE